MTAPARLIVGFDLDMTLADTRAATAATLHALCAEAGVDMDVDLVVSRLGAPFNVELANWVSEERIPTLWSRFRELFPEHGLERTAARRGALASLAAVEAAGGSSIVVTARHEATTRMILDRLGMRADAVDGWVHGPEKGRALAVRGASVYVGDTAADVVGAHVAGAVAVVVPWEGHPAATLREAGADVLLSSLSEFPAWLADWLAASATHR